MKKYAIGLDYGTNSCRSLIIDLETGAELGSHVFAYPSGYQGIITDPGNPNVARQNPQDYLDGLETIISEAIKEAGKADSNFSPEKIIAIGVDTTGSTPIPVDKTGVPLALKLEFKDNLDAMVWLWKDHTAHEEAAEITELARKMHPEYLAKCGGTYSSEWFWSKILRLKRTDPKVFNAAYSFVEHCDYLPAVLAGNTNPDELLRGVCAAGHKAMYCEEWGGLPGKDFLGALDPELADLRDRLYEKAYPSDKLAGRLCEEWALKLGLKPGIAIAVGAFDAHMGAVGSGVCEGSLVKILGTSTCDLMVRKDDSELADIPGVCGIVDGSVLPGYYGIEAGQSAVGDIFLWFVNNLCPDSYGKDLGEKFKNLNAEADKLKPGESGLMALDWNNGNRNILVDVNLSGMILGQTLHTKAHELYRTLIEATAFGAFTIIKRVEEYGVPISEIINCGGLSVKSPVLMQIYADIIGKPMKVSAIDQTCAFGAALFGAVAAGEQHGGFDDLVAAQKRLCRTMDKVYEPKPENQPVYQELYKIYRELHDAFGTSDWNGSLNHVMKELIRIRQEQRKK
jgi:L-ribulokinase